MGKRDIRGKKPNKQASKGLQWWIFAAIGAGVVGIVVLLVSFGSGGQSSPTPRSTPQKSGVLAQFASIPSWLARQIPSTQEAYAYAATHPDMLNYIPCYCGCGLHSTHRNNRDCFVAGGSGNNVVWDQHAADCAMCIDIAMMTKDMLGQGKSLAQVRKAVDDKYSSLGPGTSTPPIPGG